MVCPMCLSKGFYMKPIQGPDKREYSLCLVCNVIFTLTRFHLPFAEQKKRYEKHNNGLYNSGYVKFLNRAIIPAMKFLNSEMKGLDYGCGPSPTLSKILAGNNINCEDYDPIFYPKELEGGYDFIFATECFEHFFFPKKEISAILNLLNEDGYLIIITDLWKNPEQFKKWSYAKDLTHVTFYHKNTLDYIARKTGLTMLQEEDDRVFIFKKTPKENLSSEKQILMESSRH